jgi:hypothetical protein
MAEETKEIKIETNTQSQLPSLKNGVWLASVKQETINMNWFKHCGFGKINAARTTLLAIQAYTMVNNKLPSFVCCYGWAYNGGSQTGLHEITKVVESDMMIDNLYDTPFDDVPGVLGDPKGMACATMDKADHYRQILNKAWVEDCKQGAEAMRKMCESKFGDVPNAT